MHEALLHHLSLQSMQRNHMAILCFQRQNPQGATDTKVCITIQNHCSLLSWCQLLLWLRAQQESQLRAQLRSLVPFKVHQVLSEHLKLLSSIPSYNILNLTLQVY